MCTAHGTLCVGIPPEAALQLLSSHWLPHFKRVGCQPWTIVLHTQIKQWSTASMIYCAQKWEWKVEKREEGRGGGDGQREKKRGGIEKEGKVEEEEGKKRGWEWEREKGGLTNLPHMMFLKKLLSPAGPIRQLSTCRRGNTKCMNWRERAMVIIVKKLKRSDLHSVLKWWSVYNETNYSQ